MFTFNSVLVILLGTLVLVVGLLIAFLPPAQILRFDRQTGYGLYLREMERSGDRIRAERNAGCFYKFFGGFLTVFGIAWLIGCLIELFGG